MAQYAPKLVSKADKITNHLSFNDSKEPAGGFDSTPIPHAPPGYTVKFTFHRAVDLPLADLNTLSSDPFVFARLEVALPRRRKQDPGMTFRTPTVHKDQNPVWNADWIVANVPASGFKLKAAVYDEDASDHDDKLGLATIETHALSESWTPIREEAVKVKHRFARKRVYALTNLQKLTGHHKVSYLYVSVECLGRTPGEEGGQIFTVGPNFWFKHFSPLIGRLAGVKDQVPKQDENGKEISRYNFQAIEMQLTGPVPSEMYHRYVEFKPFVAGMFQSQSLRGRLLHKALHHQHQRIYNYDRTTLYGVFAKPCRELAQKLLEFVQYGQGGRIFTYVLMLDGMFRFTETGKEFGIDLLSKHTMHSDVTSYIAFSGEFFVRCRKSPRRVRRHHSQASRLMPSTGDRTTEFPVEEDPRDGKNEQGDDNQDSEETQEVSQEPSDYDLYIDNDSGTYRPNAKLLPQLKEFIASNFPGINITTLDCQEDADRMQELKDEQREAKTQGGRMITYLQQSSSSSLSSISSSDEDELNERTGARKPRGDFSRHVHEMRDVKGQMMRWVEHDGHPDRPKHRHPAGRDRATSLGEMRSSGVPSSTVNTGA
ncbi:Uncharacterized protein PECH_001505 [Penicillium ucsense]|uniref:C2 domain-containing protein n=1 Tax=Penicillium ucsense TaxID=2839758 RepID=A0A8J8WFK9_9EURO|nr:Uncharacterized protein PECM_001271 [Penicillium ucsense]KAF7732729.1 Uncharacterized protein PECH_001505 [Penicillium ucsense]